ncbi:hypothetical protein PN435_17595 [Nodularia spumigena CS-590/02]|uniref:phage tail protein n=1 Tax=Nodularia spumigena TaxID=70799 RepID=UPI00232B44C8|nr:hypothetical protein [Nodularia spumigena]MDB9327947.1 hypothetical protein [Nodularia spumigena CS-590/02]
MTEADITEEQLAKSNEPQFQAALDSKKTAQTHSQTAPQAYRQGEQSQLSQAESTAAATAQEKLQGMHGERSQSLEQVTGKQVDGKGKDEQSRAKIAGDIDKIYQTTKTKVDDRLAKLTTDVSDAFDAGAAEARKVFEEYVGKRMDDYKEDRYGGWFGWISWIDDQLSGMPDEVNRFYEEGRDLYLQKMDGVIDKVVAIVGTGLTEAKNDVADGRKQVKEYVAKLPEDLKEVGVEAAENIQTQFDELEQEIDSKQDELINTLAQKYKENLDAVDARIKEMQEENKGLIQKAIEFIVDVIKTIVELAKMLLEVLGRVGSVIGSILKDPIGFLSNLFNALKLGFNNFVKNIGKYLTQGLLTWLTGALPGANIQMPTSLDPQGIFSLVIQVLGVGYDAIRAKAVKRMGKDGEAKVSHLEKSFEMFRILATQGVAGVWQVIKERLGDLKTMVLDPIMQFLIENVISAGVQWIIGLMSPASAFIKACKAIYDIVKFFIEHAQQIADLINSILDAIALVASGAIDKAAQAVEDCLAKAIPVAIGFLASVLGLGGISEKVQSIIQKMRQPIEKAIDWVIDEGVKAYQVVEQKIQKTKLAKKAKAAKEAARKKKEAAQKLINKKKEALEKRYEKEKNKLPKSKAGKKQLDALKKKRDAAKKKFDAAKNWPAKKLKELMKKKDKSSKPSKKNKQKASENKVLKEKQKDLASAKKYLENIIAKSKATKEVERHFSTVKSKFGLKKLEWDKLGTPSSSIIMEVNPKATIDLSKDPLELNTGDTSHSNKFGLTQNVTFKEGKIANFPIGIKMEATRLGPNHPQGSPPTASSLSAIMGNLTTDPKKPAEQKYIKGHLLNDNLGGPGEDRNLYPITAIANKDHEAYVESVVKQWVNEQGYWVYYKVDVQQHHVDLSKGEVTADFICEANKLDSDGKRASSGAFKRTIHSEYKQIKNITPDTATHDPSAKPAYKDPGFDKKKVEHSTALLPQQVPQEVEIEIKQIIIEIDLLLNGMNVNQSYRISPISNLFGKRGLGEETTKILANPRYSINDMSPEYHPDDKKTAAQLGTWNKKIKGINKDKSKYVTRLKEYQEELEAYKTATGNQISRYTRRDIFKIAQELAKHNRIGKKTGEERARQEQQMDIDAQPVKGKKRRRDRSVIMD